MYSLSFTEFSKQYRIKNIWSPPGIQDRLLNAQALCNQALQLCIFPGFNSQWRPSILNSVLFKKPVKERIHVMIKRRLRKKL